MGLFLYHYVLVQYMCDGVKGTIGFAMLSSKKHLLVKKGKIKMPAVEFTWYDGGLLPERPAGMIPGAYLGDELFDYHHHDEPVAAIMRELEEQSILLKPLGSYPRAVL